MSPLYLISLNSERLPAHDLPYTINDATHASDVTTSSSQASVYRTPAFLPIVLPQRCTADDGPTSCSRQEDRLTTPLMTSITCTPSASSSPSRFRLISDHELKQKPSLISWYGLLKYVLYFNWNDKTNCYFYLLKTLRMILQSFFDWSVYMRLSMIYWFSVLIEMKIRKPFKNI